MRTELRRQLVHASGIFIILSVIFLGKTISMILVGLIFLVLSIISYYRYKEMKIIWPLRFLSKLEKHFETEVLKFERRGEFPLLGAITFFIGVLLSLLFFPEEIAIPAIAVLALADSASTLIGKEIGEHKLPINRKKSWEGSITFFIVTGIILTFFTNPFKALLIAVLVTFVEMIPVDDNLTIPLTVGLLMLI